MRQKVNKMASEVNEKITMVEMAKIVNELKVKADNSEVSTLRNDLDEKERDLIEKSAKQGADLMKHVQEEKAPLLEQIEHLKNELNTMKLNVIASGQIVAGFTTEQGMALTGEVAKLGEKLDGLMRDQ